MERLATLLPSCSRRRTAPAAALLVALLACTSPAAVRADIVWNDQQVGAWPDLDLEPPPPDDRDELGDPAAAVPFQQAGRRGFYPSPKGNVYGLTILVDFSDQPPAFDEAQVDAWLNQKGYTAGGLNGSVRDYFLDNSNGQVDFQNEVVGFYRAAKPKSYYEAGTSYERARELFQEVIAGVDAEVDFSKFDNDGDGRTEALSIVYAGERGQFGRGLWPHAGGSSTRRDGVVLARYTMSPLSKQLTLNMFVHEAGHMLFGWPDLYGVGDYCVMASASNPLNPAGINDFFRADQGWIPQVPITRETRGTFTATVNGAGYTYVNPRDAGELYFWSNVQNTGRFRVLRGSGILMFHFQHARRVNNPPNPLTLSVVQADALEQLGVTKYPRPGSDPNDFFVASGTATFTDDTKPSAKWANGTPSGLRLVEVGANGREIRFSVGAASAASARVAESDREVAADGTDEQPADDGL